MERIVRRLDRIASMSISAQQRKDVVIDSQAKGSRESKQQNIPHQWKNRAGGGERFSETTAIDAESSKGGARQGKRENEQQTGDQKKRALLKSFQ